MLSSACTLIPQGAHSQLIVSGTLATLATVDFGPPLHALVLVGATDAIEEDMVRFYAISASTPLLPDDADTGTV